jgi:hypothetical protein
MSCRDRERGFGSLECLGCVLVLREDLTDACNWALFRRAQRWVTLQIEMPLLEPFSSCQRGVYVLHHIFISEYSTTLCPAECGPAVLVGMGVTKDG